MREGLRDARERGERMIGQEMDEGDKEMQKGIDREVGTLIEERNRMRVERVMEGNRKDKEIEKGGHCETMKTEVGGRTGREGECMLAKRKKVQKDRFKMEQRGKR